MKANKKLKNMIFASVGLYFLFLTNKENQCLAKNRSRKFTYLFG